MQFVWFRVLRKTLLTFQGQRLPRFRGKSSSIMLNSTVTFWRENVCSLWMDLLIDKTFSPVLCKARGSWIPWRLSFRYMLFHDTKTPNDAVTPQRLSQFTANMKANMIPRLLSSLVWIDHCNQCNRMRSLMEFMGCCQCFVYQEFIRFYLHI